MVKITLPESTKNRSTLRTLSFAREFLLLDGEAAHAEDIATVEDMMSQIPDCGTPGSQPCIPAGANGSLISLFDWYASLQDLSALLKKAAPDKAMDRLLDFASSVIFDDIVGEDEEYSRKNTDEADADIKKINSDADEVRRSVAARIWKLIHEAEEEERTGDTRTG